MIGNLNNKTHCLVLDQYRVNSRYNDLIGKAYHFPQKYLNFFNTDNEKTEFIYYEPKKSGKGVYFGYGIISKPPIKDTREKDLYIVEIDEYNPFQIEVPYLGEKGPREGEPFYNPQNAVRRIYKKDLDEICLDGNITLHFKADAHLLKVLGEELIATEKVGILELIKNAYDAQAKHCTIYIEKVPGLVELPNSAYKFEEFEGPVIVIEDDGIGMDKNTIENGWLRPASTIKTNIKTRIKEEREKAIAKGQLGTFDALVKKIKNENGGRLPVGEKGVGRFATRRLGRKLLMKTKVNANEYEYILEIDWDKFDTKHDSVFVDLNSVGMHLTRRKPTRQYGERNSGTQLIIYGGRPGFDVDEKLIREINQTVLQMKSPFKGPEDFEISISCPQLPDLEKELVLEEFEPVFSFNGLVNESGICDFELEFFPPRSVPLPEQKTSDKKYDLRNFENKYWLDKNKKLRKPRCGQFLINIDAWYRTGPWIEGPRQKEFYEYLERFGGIAIFRDGLNVFSSEFGSKLDWLGLSTKIIKRGVNISYYNIIGSIELDQTSNIELIDKTNREGLLNNTAFKDLSILTQAVVLYLNNHFKAKRDEYNNLSGDILRDPKKISDISKQASHVVNGIGTYFDSMPRSLLDIYDSEGIDKQRITNLAKSLKKLEKSLKAMQHVQDLLTEQAGFGLAVAVAVHEIAKLTSNFYDKVLIVANGGDLSYNQREELKSSLESLKEELKKLSPLRALRNEAKQLFDVTRSIKFVYEVYRKKIEKAGIQFIIESQKSFKVYARFGALNQVLSNLIDNSIYWLENKEDDHKVIKLKIDDWQRSILFSDSNGDIDESILPHIFEPGYSLKNPPSGLGLYICKHYMFDMKGYIYIAPQKERDKELTGAQFILDFSKTPSKKESF